MSEVLPIIVAEARDYDLSLSGVELFRGKGKVAWENDNRNYLNPISGNLVCNQNYIGNEKFIEKFDASFLGKYPVAVGFVEVASGYDRLDKTHDCTTLEGHTCYEKADPLAVNEENDPIFKKTNFARELNLSNTPSNAKFELVEQQIKKDIIEHTSLDEARGETTFDNNLVFNSGEEYVNERALNNDPSVFSNLFNSLGHQCSKETDTFILLEDLKHVNPESENDRVEVLDDIICDLPENFSFSDETALCEELLLGGESAQEGFGSVSTFGSLDKYCGQFVDVDRCSNKYSEQHVDIDGRSDKYSEQHVDIDGRSDSYCEQHVDIDGRSDKYSEQHVDIDGHSDKYSEQHVDIDKLSSKYCGQSSNITRVYDPLGAFAYGRPIPRVEVDSSFCEVPLLDNYRNTGCSRPASMVNSEPVPVAQRGFVETSLSHFSTSLKSFSKQWGKLDNVSRNFVSTSIPKLSNEAAKNKKGVFQISKQSSIIEEVGIDAGYQLDNVYYCTETTVDEVATSTSEFFDPGSEEAPRRLGTEVNANKPPLTTYGSLDTRIGGRTVKKQWVVDKLNRRRSLKSKRHSPGIT
uniref:Uncharacterized protein n=1 Tax=Timema cristinae TaxID=61476 RepID=A0A7R9GR74_TIMCR|nr:unnamed protein product [Timema cristinae]